MTTQVSAITWSARPGGQAHAFRMNSAGWSRSACGQRWTAAHYDHNAPHCRDCISVLRSEARDRARTEPTESELRASWGDR